MSLLNSVKLPTYAAVSTGKSVIYSIICCVLASIKFYYFKQIANFCSNKEQTFGYIIFHQKGIRHSILLQSQKKKTNTFIDILFIFFFGQCKHHMLHEIPSMNTCISRGKRAKSTKRFRTTQTLVI